MGHCLLFIPVQEARMATFEKRGNYQWRAKIRLRGFPPQSKTFNTKAEAEAWAKMTESEMLRGVWISRSEAEQTLFREALQRYQEEVVPQKKSAKQITSQIRLLTSHLGNYALASLSSSVIARFRDQRLKSVDPQTVRKDLSLIQRVLNIAAKEWGIALPHGNPLLQIRLPKQPSGRNRRLLQGEEQRLLAELSKNPTINALVLFAMETAMRRGEIVAMRWEHIDYKARTLMIPETKMDAPREVPLSSKALEVLRGLPCRVDGIVWGVRSDSITRAFDRACKRAEIEGLRFHDLRHEATSRFFEHGLNIMEVASITGHKDLKMLKRYTHLRAEDVAKKLG